MQLEMWLTWIVGGGGAGAITYWIMEQWAHPNLTSELKRYTSLTIAGSLAVLAFCVSVGMEYQPGPATTQAWIEQLFAVAFVAVTTGQVLHGRNRLREKVQIIE